MTTPFVVALDLLGRRCVVVGIGSELDARVASLLGAGAQVRVVSEAPSEAVRRWAENGEIDLVVREFDVDDIRDAWLVTLVDQNPELARRIADEATSRHTLFCALDQPEFNSFAHVAKARAGSLEVAISTGGRAPALAKKLRVELERCFEENEVGAFVDDLADLRERTPRDDRKDVLGRAVANVSLRLDVRKKR